MGLRGRGWILLLGLFFCGVGGTASESVKYVAGGDYFSVVQREMARARSSVSVCLYLFSFRPEESDSPVFELAESLARAHGAGVKVEVLLDQNFNFVEGEPFNPFEGKNTAAYTYLKALGIPVSFDRASTYTHSKVVVIDEETVILGSSNWSYSALTKNLEANVLIRSTTVARAVLDSFAEIPREEPLWGEFEGGVDVPGKFLEDSDLLGRMISTPDERAFDAYLFILQQSSTSFRLNYEEMAQALGIGHMDRFGYRRQINRILRKLQKKYELIRFAPHYGEDPMIEVLPLMEGDRSVRVPGGYWSLGWDRRLSFAGKCFFLVSRYEAAVSTLRPRWSVAQSTLARRYGGRAPFWGQGVTDLRRWNLLEVEYAPYAFDGTSPRKPTLYTPNALYDPLVLDQKFLALEATYGGEAVDRARNAAAVVYEDKDIRGIEELLKLGTRYGWTRVDEALEIVRVKNPDNPLRTMGYLIGVVRGWGTFP